MAQCKGFFSQNILAVCGFDMYFTNVMYGWEGSVADSHLWIEADRTTISNIPAGKYVLKDAGFANCKSCLVPYCNVRYHVQQWAHGNRGPQDAKELFNLRHSQLRNVVERIFGVMMARYEILTYPQPFKMVAQLRVVAALCTLHNILNLFIKEDEENAEKTFAEDAGGYIADETERAYNILQAEKDACSA